jgi:transposase
MPNRRLSMRKIRQILRLKHEAGLSDRQIAASCALPRSSIANYLERARDAGLSWPLPGELDDEALYARLFTDTAAAYQPTRPLPDWESVHKDLRRKGMTLQLLWEEYRQDHPDGYGYTQFCNYYRNWKQDLHVVMRLQHVAGERTFVDWAGQTIPWTDPGTGQVQQALLFIAVLGCSNYTFAEAFPTKQLWHWIEAHVHTFAFFGGVTELLVPDNEATGVTRACRYEPTMQRTYQDMAEHYGVVTLPTRPRKPRDKAKAEAAVQHAERRLLAPLRHHTFFGVGQINEALRPLLHQLNDRPFQKLDGSRRVWFEQLDQPALRPLPDMPYEFAEWGTGQAGIDYHVQVDRCFYSVPHTLARKGVIEHCTTARTVELLRNGQRVAVHQRCWKPGRHITDPAHMPKAHRRHMEWTPGHLVDWAAKVGADTATAVRRILESKPHPEHGYRACLGLMSLAKRHGHERTEAACRRALALNSPTYQSIKSILQTKREHDPLPGQQTPKPPTPTHGNVRGQAYYGGDATDDAS